MADFSLISVTDFELLFKILILVISNSNPNLKLPLFEISKRDCFVTAVIYERKMFVTFVPDRTSECERPREWPSS